VLAVEGGKDEGHEDNKCENDEADAPKVTVTWAVWQRKK
jgi:hypothetical protein